MKEIWQNLLYLIQQAKYLLTKLEWFGFRTVYGITERMSLEKKQVISVQWWGHPQGDQSVAEKCSHGVD